MAVRCTMAIKILAGKTRRRQSAHAQPINRKQAAGQRLLAALFLVQEVTGRCDIHDVEVWPAKAAHRRPADGKPYQTIEPAIQIESTDRPIPNQRGPIISFVVEIGAVDPPRQVAGIEEIRLFEIAPLAAS